MYSDRIFQMYTKQDFNFINIDIHFYAISSSHEKNEQNRCFT